MCLNETYGRVGKNLSDMFPIKNGLKQGDALSPLLFNFALQYAIKKVQVNQDGLKLNSTHQLLAYADHVNIVSGSVYTVKKKQKLQELLVRRLDQKQMLKLSIWSCLEKKTQDELTI